LRERFRNVILGAGYTNPAPIIAQYFEIYMEPSNVEGFLKMLCEYEQDQREREAARKSRCDI